MPKRISLIFVVVLLLVACQGLPQPVTAPPQEPASQEAQPSEMQQAEPAKEESAEKITLRLFIPDGGGRPRPCFAPVGFEASARRRRHGARRLPRPRARSRNRMPARPASGARHQGAQIRARRRIRERREPATHLSLHQSLNQI